MWGAAKARRGRREARPCRDSTPRLDKAGVSPWPTKPARPVGGHSPGGEPSPWGMCPCGGRAAGVSRLREGVSRLREGTLRSNERVTVATVRRPPRQHGVYSASASPTARASLPPKVTRPPPTARRDVPRCSPRPRRSGLAHRPVAQPFGPASATAGSPPANLYFSSPTRGGRRSRGSRQVRTDHSSGKIR